LRKNGFSGDDYLQFQEKMTAQATRLVHWTNIVKAEKVLAPNLSIENNQLRALIAAFYFSGPTFADHDGNVEVSNLNENIPQSVVEGINVLNPNTNLYDQAKDALEHLVTFRDNYEVWYENVLISDENKNKGKLGQIKQKIDPYSWKKVNFFITGNMDKKEFAANNKDFERKFYEAVMKYGSDPSPQNAIKYGMINKDGKAVTFDTSMNHWPKMYENMAATMEERQAFLNGTNKNLTKSARSKISCIANGPNDAKYTSNKYGQEGAYLGPHGSHIRRVGYTQGRINKGDYKPATLYECKPESTSIGKALGGRKQKTFTQRSEIPIKDLFDEHKWDNQDVLDAQAAAKGYQPQWNKDKTLKGADRKQANVNALKANNTSRKAQMAVYHGTSSANQNVNANANANANANPANIAPLKRVTTGQLGQLGQQQGRLSAGNQPVQSNLPLTLRQGGPAFNAPQQVFSLTADAKKSPLNFGTLVNTRLAGQSNDVKTQVITAIRNNLEDNAKNPVNAGYSAETRANQVAFLNAALAQLATQ